jgi:hypothetical protein
MKGEIMSVIMGYLDAFMTLLERLAKIHKELILLIFMFLIIFRENGFEIISLIIGKL